MADTETKMTIRAPRRSDSKALARFAAAMPPHDLLFLARDIREPKVLEAWLAAQEQGQIASLILTTAGPARPIRATAGGASRLIFRPR